MDIVFYNVKKRKKVKIGQNKISKTKYENKKNKTTRYAFRAVDDDGTALTKFCSKKDWDTVTAPVKS